MRNFIIQSFYETPTPHGAQLHFTQSIVAELYQSMFVKHLGTDELVSGEKLAHFIICDFLVKTSLPQENLVFVGTTSFANFRGEIFGGHEASNLSGDFILNGFGVRDQTIVSARQAYTTPLNDPAGAMIFDENVDQEEVLTKLDQTGASRPGLRILAYSTGRNTESLLNGFRARGMEPRISYWSKAPVRVPSGANRPAEMRHLIFVETE